MGVLRERGREEPPSPRDRALQVGTGRHAGRRVSRAARHAQREEVLALRSQQEGTKGPWVSIDVNMVKAQLKHGELSRVLHPTDLHPICPPITCSLPSRPAPNSSDQAYRPLPSGAPPI